MGKYLKFLNNVKKNITKYGSKKIIEKALIIAIIGVILLIAGSVLFDGGSLKGSLLKGSTAAPSENSGIGAETSGTMKKQSGDEYEDEMEKGLESILSEIKGAGRVNVMLTYYSGNESVPAYDVKTSGSDTQEKDKEGGTRSVKQNDNENTVIYQEEQGAKKPFIVKELLPKVKGVVIVADGAGNPDVQNNLAIAAQALLDVAAHKIQVFQRNGN